MKNEDKRLISEGTGNETRQYGKGAAVAAFRQGFAELTNALKAFPDSLPLIEQPGQLNNVPPQAVSQQAGFSNKGPSRSEMLGIIEQHMQRLQNQPQQSIERDLSK